MRPLQEDRKTQTEERVKVETWREVEREMRDRITSAEKQATEKKCGEGKQNCKGV